MALCHTRVKMLSRSNRNCVGALAYRSGCKLIDSQTSESFDYSHKEVQHVELILPENAPQWARDMQKLIVEDREQGAQAFSDMAERHEKRLDGQVYREFEFALQKELSDEQNIILAREFLQDQVAGRGIAVLANFHMDVDLETGERKPHCHAVLLTRQMEEGGLSPLKDRRWEKRDFIKDLREQLAAYTNFHLKLHGHDVRVDHRSYKDQGIDLEPQPKHGKKAQGLERQLNKVVGKEEKSFIHSSPFTDKGQAFREVQLRNLYRIVRKPEVIFDIVTRHHTTFMWGDVQKVLHRYVDNPELFQRLENRLKSSKDLLLLKPDMTREEGEAGEQITDPAIYTTHRLLQEEKSLIKTAEALVESESHSVSEGLVEEGLKKAQEQMGDKGHRLSPDQEKAIRHLVGGGQLKCIVGYAGAGKTTALETCREIWEEQGYRVYGLAPTGRAAKNLEDSGIPSQTLHKFLKSFEEGRCQYSKDSVLVLDEGGMVDVEHFQAFLSSVRELGVKAVVVGDGAQLQPVEAGPAFRLVTTRVGVSHLEEIVRQKEKWQKEATLLFGRGETKRAIEVYQTRGHVCTVEEALPEGNTPEEIVKRYEMTSRTSGLIFREIKKEVQEKYPGLINISHHVKRHQDFGTFERFKDLQKTAGGEILRNPEAFRPYLEARRLDPLEMARLFVDKDKGKEEQYREAAHTLKKKKLDHLIGVERVSGQGVEVRSAAKEALLQDWKEAYKENPSQSLAMMAYSNRDVRDLNEKAREFLKEEGILKKAEKVYTITRDLEDDFGRKTTIKEERAFSEGDRIVFTRNKRDLGVSNGSIGTIVSLEKNTMTVFLDKGRPLKGSPFNEESLDGQLSKGSPFNENPLNGKSLSDTPLGRTPLSSTGEPHVLAFSPKMFSYFDQGWAITIHKSQGMTVDKSFVLASHEMSQNLSYVAMTRHREDVRVYGSSLNFWREEKVPEVLSKSGDKLGASDYLDAKSLASLMKEEDKFLEKLFTRVSDELQAMGAITKQAFEKVSMRFFGTSMREGLPILIPPVALREEQRAQEILYGYRDTGSLSYAQGPENSTRNVFAHKEQSQGQSVERTPFIDAERVEEALKQNIASFADDVFTSLGEPYNRSVSSAIQRRYGEKGHISVNLRTGQWINFKENDLSGGPLQMLTHLKGLSFKEALEHGASWAGIGHELSKQVSLTYTPKTFEKNRPQENEAAEDKERIEKAKALWDKGISLEGTLAARYLREHRKIEGSLSEELRFLPSFKDYSSAQAYPCLMARARSASGELTAVQITFLNPETGGKADLPVSKRSFGVLKGSYVTLQEDHPSKPLLVAEGVETALSLKAAGVEGTIIASLGLSNLKRIEPKSQDTPLIICADHDAPESPATRSLEKSVTALQEKGFSVSVIKSPTLGDDFNDVLKKEGPKALASYLRAALQLKEKSPSIESILEQDRHKNEAPSQERKEEVVGASVSERGTHKNRVEKAESRALASGRLTKDSFEMQYRQFTGVIITLEDNTQKLSDHNDYFKKVCHQLSRDQEFMTRLWNHDRETAKGLETLVDNTRFSFTVVKAEDLRESFHGLLKKESVRKLNSLLKSPTENSNNLKIAKRGFEDRYHQLKDMVITLEKNPKLYVLLKSDFRDVCRDLCRDKEFMRHLLNTNKEIAKVLETMANEKILSKDRGGISL